MHYGNWWILMHWAISAHLAGVTSYIGSMLYPSLTTVMHHLGLFYYWHTYNVTPL